MDISLNEDTGILKVGDNEWDILTRVFTFSQGLRVYSQPCWGILTEVFNTSFTESLGYPSKESSKRFTKHVGITPSKFLKLVRDLQFKYMVKDLNPKVLFGCYGRRMSDYKRPMMSSSRRLYIPPNFKVVKPLLVQAVKDGMDNLTPLIAHTAKEPKELKKIVGKGVWKKLCHNSLTRNSLLVASDFTDCGVELRGNLLNVPSTLLKSSVFKSFFGDWYVASPKIALCIARIAKELRVMTDNREVRKIGHTIFDTIRMAEMKGQSYNFKWSWNRWQQEHERLSMLINAAKYERDKILKDAYKVLPRDFSCKYGEAVLLETPADVAQEGVKMRHCIASYADRCSEGKYAVYHITDKNGEESTLGIVPSVTGENKLKWSLNQHYTKFNQPASVSCDQVRKALLKTILINGEKIHNNP
jgi:hypothetical protein